jgi:hypothetical protein
MHVLLRRIPTLLAAVAAIAAGSAACSSSPVEDSESKSLAATAPPAASYSILRAGNRYAGDVGDAYVDHVQTALSRRCAVCHSCTNGPCQLNMTSFAAITRGVSSVNPYKFGLFDTFPTRVADNRPLSEWRSRGFRSVLPDAGSDPKESVFFKALELGDKNVPSASRDEGPLDMTTVRALAKAHDDGAYVCPATGAEYANLVSQHPMGGMPWGLPAVDADDHATLENWVLAGAPGPSPEAQHAIASPQRTAMSKMDPAAIIAAWEAFFDAGDLRGQLVSRYLFEHLYSANIHFEENPGEFYRLVRSRTGAPDAIDAIITDEPVDDPSWSGRVHYRLQKIDRVIEGKTHVPWPVSMSDLDHLERLFYQTPWSVSSLPDYSSRNPFENFEPIPAAARSQFMIENAKVLYAGFARGPICLIQAASYAVDEYFWIWFVKPESDPSVLQPKLGLDSYATFFSKDGNLVSGVPVLGDKYGEPTYRAAFEKTLRALKPNGIGLDDVWTGGPAHNPNAWLTVHRNQVSVDVNTTLERPITGMPHSVWLITYANFERMYYNAVAEYKYWGSLKHQNDSFNWQIYTRTEAEDLYTSLFPDQSYRDTLRSKFTSFGGMLYNKLFTDYAKGRPSASPTLHTEDDFGRALYAQMSGTLGPADRLNHWPDDSLPSKVLPTIATTDDFEAGLRTLTAREAPFAGYMPNVVHLRLGGQYLYTLLAVRGYRGDKISTAEASARQRQHDTMVAVAGLSAYEAHLFVDLPFEKASAFLTDLGNVGDLTAWNAFEARYGIARNSAQLWPFVDWLNHWQEQNIPVRAGLLEMRVYEKDELPF